MKHPTGRHKPPPAAMSLKKLGDKITAIAPKREKKSKKEKKKKKQVHLRFSSLCRRRRIMLP